MIQNKFDGISVRLIHINVDEARMKNTLHNQIKCQFCQEPEQRKLVPAAIVRKSIIDEIKKVNSTWDADGFICQNDLNKYRQSYITSLLEKEKGIGPPKIKPNTISKKSVNFLLSNGSPLI